MKVILTHDVPHLGSLGDEVQVKNGYARNFLLPRGYAIAFGSKNAREIAHRRKFLESERQQAIEQAKTESDKVAALKLVVQAKAGLNGRLFGSVTNRDVQRLLEQQGYNLDRRSIQLHSPIKNLGNFTATVKLHTDVKVDIAIKVEPLLEEGGAPAEQPPAEGEAATAEGEAATTEGAVESLAAESGPPPTGDATPEGVTEPQAEEPPSGTGPPEEGAGEAGQ